MRTGSGNGFGFVSSTLDAVLASVCVHERESVLGAGGLGLGGAPLVFLSTAVVVKALFEISGLRDPTLTSGAGSSLLSATAFPFVSQLMVDLGISESPAVG